VRPLHIGIAGTGKIARERHIPAIRQERAFELVACANCCAPVEEVPNYGTLDEMLAACRELDAVAICSPPQTHYDVARAALEHRKHVLMEKPPCPTVLQLDHLHELAGHAGRTLFQTWHLRHLPAVDAFQRWLMSRTIRRGRIVWKEDVRRWHPGQAWLWQTDGFGVFDAGINALSILTKVIPDPIFVRSADLFIPSNCQTPIAASMKLETGEAEISAEFDFRHKAETVWDIELATDDGTARLMASENRLILDDGEQPLDTTVDEYACLYRHFDQLIGERRSDVDERPLKLVADIFLVGRQHAVEPFNIG